MILGLGMGTSPNNFAPNLSHVNPIFFIIKLYYSLQIVQTEMYQLRETKALVEEFARQHWSGQTNCQVVPCYLSPRPAFLTFEACCWSLWLQSRCHYFQELGWFVGHISTNGRREVRQRIAWLNRPRTSQHVCSYTSFWRTAPSLSRPMSLASSKTVSALLRQDMASKARSTLAPWKMQPRH